MIYQRKEICRFQDRWYKVMEDKITDIVEQLSDDEKISLAIGKDFWSTNAINRLGIPSVMMCDATHGLRKQVGKGDHLGINQSIETVSYPTASALASSFDKELMRKLGRSLGQECKTEDVGMLLGPGLNMKRSPLCGRNFEYFSEDPYLTGELAAEYIQGLQCEGIAACPKHFAVNNQETRRISSSSELDERTLREIYLPAFETVVKKGKTRSIMCAYNAVNGTFCSVNKRLLTEILRIEWGFDGFVVTDWGAGKDAVQGVKAGLDLNMPGGRDDILSAIKSALESGDLSRDELNRMAYNMIKFAIDYKEQSGDIKPFDRYEAAKFSEEIAEQCAILLKNDGVLPLSMEKKVAFIGEFAKTPRYQGGGSSHVNTMKVVSALDASDGLNIVYAKGYSAKPDLEKDAKLFNEAIEVAKNAEAVVVFAGLPDEFESEGFDRNNLDIPENQNKLINAIAEMHSNVTVVLHGGSAMTFNWLDKVQAVLCMYLGGMAVGEAAVKLLYGVVNPSGKLAETWPRKLSDTPSYLNFPGNDGIVEYKEGIFIGYRYYDKKEMEVLFPFGYGLSYTQFEYSDMEIDKNEMKDTDTLTVSIKVKNIGERFGKEVVQLYVKNPEGEVIRPVRELRDFAKVCLEANEVKKITFTLDKKAFAYYETKLGDFFVPEGIYGIEIAASSRDIKYHADVHIVPTNEIPYTYTLRSTIGSLMKTKKGRSVKQYLLNSLNKESGLIADAETVEAMGEGAGKMVQAMVDDMPLAVLSKYGNMSERELKEIVAMLNKKE